MTYPPPPYADAVCGTPITGEAICGAWWAYPQPSGLGLGGYPPVVVVLEVGVVPPAGLRLGAWVPALSISPAALVVTPAGLRLGTVVPSYLLSQRLSTAPAGLRLSTAPGRAYVVWIVPGVCVDLPLVAAPEQELALAAASCTTIPLTRARCR